MNSSWQFLSLIEKNPVSLPDLSERFRTGKLSPRDYMRQLRSLFEEKEPLVRSFVTETPQCFESYFRELDQLETAFPEPSSFPLLFGIPVGVKDIFRVAGFSTRAGSHLPPDLFEGPEAKVVTVLKSEGALILGKTVTTEFAHVVPGPTRNPHNLDHTPGGSSSGSAAAVAAGLCPLALGSQTGGSIIRPASYCGVVGFKPSYGRIPTEGVIPVAPSLDHVGFFTTDVKGAILVASVICKGWNMKQEFPQPVFGVPEGLYLEKACEEMLNHFWRTCDRLSDAGFEIRFVEMLGNFEEVNELFNTLIIAETAQVQCEWFQSYSGRYHKITAELIKKGSNIGLDVLEVCRNGREKFRNEILTIMKHNNISALLSPAAVDPAPRGLENTGDPIMNRPWSYAGLPVVNIPSGKSREGLPLGLQMVGTWWGDELLLEVAKKVAQCLE